MNVLILGEGRMGKLIRRHLELNGCQVMSTRQDDWKLGGSLKKSFQSFEKCHVVGTLPPSAWESVKGSGLEKLFSQIDVQSLTWISSTCVYEGLSGLCDENSLEIGAGKTFMSAVEKRLKQQFEDVNIVRCGGLLGEGSHPAQFLSKKRLVKIESAPVNLVWRSDAATIVGNVILANSKGQLINACSSEHPSKISYYTLMMNKLGLPVSLFELNGQSDRCIDGSKALGLGFIESYRTIYDSVITT